MNVSLLPDHRVIFVVGIVSVSREREMCNETFLKDSKIDSQKYFHENQHEFEIYLNLPSGLNSNSKNSWPNFPL